MTNYLNINGTYEYISSNSDKRIIYNKFNIDDFPCILDITNDNLEMIYFEILTYLKTININIYNLHIKYIYKKSQNSRVINNNQKNVHRYKSYLSDSHELDYVFYKSLCSLKINNRGIFNKIIHQTDEQFFFNNFLWHCSVSKN